MEAYKLWVRKNREFVHSLESLANGITWLLPERFSDSEIGPEAVYAFLGVVSAVNQHIIETTPSRIHPRGSGDSFPWSLCISMLKDVEAVVEVAAQHFAGEEGKWNFIAATEAVKALFRLAVFRDGGYRMLLQGGESVNVDKGPDVAGVPHGGVGNLGSPVGYHGPGYIPEYHGYIPRNLEGRAINALNRFGENAKMALDPEWLNRLRRTSESPELPVKKLTLSNIWSEKGLSGGLFVTGEALFILRPLIYVLFIRKYGIRSWTPWLISLAVDLTGMGVFSYATSQGSRSGDKFYQLSSSEKDELKRRKLIWALYIMRDPFFTKHTKNRLEKTDKYLSQVPFIGFLTAKLIELIEGAQTRYTYTSGS
ncbi:peroxisome biogenesis protein 16 [Phoenix dactylifera]|uniref:Peroxisomal membrane protein PEX16 n=1 Tax=Phoenix dactylifera TaxID=42345 RepID=A0A8B7BHL3_PHODC|nr:peroxisome biogenesis protein 16 [Phoenix dactylifera]XP_008776684.1 peroxisome biogenesis protein 16 [Phoenix dactylifera]XP_026656820.1 peroxisome biogenesis protein 16 [Phoenix dactylifera]XP_026656822.1 peroxisome biogenesis protein 16 [Phoenix dactylifera]